MKNDLIKNQHLPKIAVRFANLFFCFATVLSILVVVYAIYRYQNGIISNQKFYFVYILFGVISASLFGLGLRLNNSLKVNLSLLFIVAGISIYAFEIYLEFLPELSQTPRKIAERMGISYDTRTKMQVLEDLNKIGVEAYPNICPTFFIGTNGLLVDNEKIYPLGGIPEVSVIFNNESGYYPVIRTDEHGFNNPKGLYRKNEVDIMIVGDSFAEGYSVHADESIAAVLREEGFNTISIGKGGNGPLTELAAIKEYAEPLRPKVVLWLYLGHDISVDLTYELNSLVLKKYLNEDDFSQNLILRQEEIRGALISHALKEWMKKYKPIDAEDRFIKILKLRNFRLKINVVPEGVREKRTVFKNILERAENIISKWGGAMYFVYLPEFDRYLTGDEYPSREYVLRTADELDIPVIDIHREVFDLHSDPVSLFPFRSGGHYNAEGYRLVTEAIGKRLAADGVIPSNSDNQKSTEGAGSFSPPQLNTPRTLTYERNKIRR